MATIDFTVADVLAWARTKPADERYSYADPANCALCHFLRDTGRSSDPLVKPYCDGIDGGWRTRKSGDVSYSPYPSEIEPALELGRTFGGLVAILEGLAPQTEMTPINWLSIDAYLTDIEQVVLS